MITKNSIEIVKGSLPSESGDYAKKPLLSVMKLELTYLAHPKAL